MKTQNAIPDPDKELRIIKRYFHILALIQNKKDPKNWNGTSLADMLSLDEDKPLTDKVMRDYINEELKNKLNIDVNMEKGSRKIELNEPIKNELLEKIAIVYSSFITTDSTKENVLKNLIKIHPEDCLWLMARIYFAIKEKKRIRIDYTNNAGKRYEELMCHPYHMVFRNNNFYLAAKTPYGENPWLFILNKISNVKVEDAYFDEKIPLVDEIFKDTLGSYIGESCSVKIKFKKDIVEIIEQMLGFLDPIIEEIDDSDECEARFDVSDSMYLCKQLFLYGNRVEIVEPVQLRQMMFEMLKESMEIYSA